MATEKGDPDSPEETYWAKGQIVGEEEPCSQWLGEDKVGWGKREGGGTGTR